jgi:hypothetical protein
MADVDNQGGELAVTEGVGHGEFWDAVRIGDERLRDHIDQSITALAAALETANQQTQLALASAEKLELERIAGARAQTQGVEERMFALVEAKSEQFRLVHKAAEVAIDKASTANEKRFEAANEWRGQSADRERSQAEEIAKLATTFVRSETVEAMFRGLRESMDAQIGELRRLIGDLADKVNKVV